jgi:hypothetical protein
MKIEIVEHWNKLLQKIPIEKRDIYFTEEYVRLSIIDDRKAYCIVCQENKNIILMPFRRGKVGTRYDFETPYGYGGPISNCEDPNWLKRALQCITEYFYEHNYLCGFIRFHPLLKNSTICQDYMKVIDDRYTIAIDTSMTEDEIWRTQISSKNRNMIRKAKKNGLTFEADESFQYINEFELLYNATMDRLHAESFYFLDSKYYDEFKKNMVGHGFIGIVRAHDHIIGAALFMIYGPYGHYHLAGSDRSMATYGINNFLLWNAAKKMHESGVHWFHLGGGLNGDPENSLFKFKKSFSSNLFQFSIGKIVIDEKAYENICKDWERRYPELVPKYHNFLLKYRFME